MLLHILKTLNITHFAKKGFKDITLKEWLSASLNIKPVENLSSTIKRDVYESGK